MGSVATAFGSTGSMSHANVHMGKVKIYNELDVEDKATFEGDVEVQGTLITNRMQLGETVITEKDFKKLKKGVNGVIDDASLAPAEKKLKLEECQDQAEVNTGYKETNDTTDEDDYLQVKGVVSQDQVFSHAGFVTTDPNFVITGTDEQGNPVGDFDRLSSIVTPNAVATDNLVFKNLIARDYDLSVTSGGVPNEINVKAQKIQC